MNQSSETTISNLDIVGSSATNCPSCGAHSVFSELFCHSCGHVRPVGSEVDYFNVFHLPRKLKLDLAGLEREFYRLSRKLHPDAYARASQQEQESSLANSSLLNDAYRTLKDPIKRTEYLLAVEGAVSGDDGGVKEDRVPADLLEEVFELNMQLEEMRLNRKMGEDDPQLEMDLQAAKTSFDAQLVSADTRLQALWNEWDTAVDNGDDRKQRDAKEELAALLDRRRYIRNLVNSVDEAIEA